MKDQESLSKEFIKFVITKIVEQIFKGHFRIAFVLIFCVFIGSLALTPQYFSYRQENNRIQSNVSTRGESRELNLPSDDIQTEVVNPRNPRRTVTLVNGEILREFNSPNLTNTNGDVSVDILNLNSPVQLGNGTTYFKDYSGFLFSNDTSAGWYNPLSLPFTNATTFTVGEGQTTGTTSINLGDSLAFRYNHTTNKIEYYDAGWLEVGSGSGADWALSSPDHTNIFATHTKTGQFTGLNLDDFQATVFVYLEDLATAESFFHRTELGYSCTVQRWGKNAGNQLIWEVGTEYASTCLSTVYASAWTFSSETLGRWVEISMQVDDTGAGLAFYVDGVMSSFQSYSTTLVTQSTANETFDIYPGIKGKGGPLKIGNKITWPITTDAWKGIDTKTHSYPGLVWAIPLQEGRGLIAEEIISSTEFTIDADISWKEIEGGL